MMKGDLHTLKKVCQYGSKVMLAGVLVLSAVLIVLAILGAGSFFSDSISQVFQDCIGARFGTDSSTKVAGSFLGIELIFLLALLTVVTTYRVMVSIHTEHSPFHETNTERVKLLSQIYLVFAAVLAALFLIAGNGLASACFIFFGCVLVSVILYIFALIVRYGAVLQNESDHTL